MNPRLYIEALDNPEEHDAVTTHALIKGLERRVAERYNVYPVRSGLAYEQFDCGDERRRLVHVVFGVCAEGSMQDIALVNQLVLALWDAVRRAWAEGALVMWRRHPEISEAKGSNFDIGKPDDPDAPTIVKITMRLGSFEAPNPHPLLAGDGEMIKTLAECAQLL